MRVHATLTVIDDAVLCPRSGDWKHVAACACCADVQALDLDVGHAVVCEPEIDRLPLAYRLASHD